MARDVLLNSGVAIVNFDFDPIVPYFSEILITCPERICSYDETRMEFDCTRPSAGKTDRCLRDGDGDDGTTIVTKSSKSGSTICG